MIKNLREFPKSRPTHIYRGPKRNRAVRLSSLHSPIAPDAQVLLYLTQLSVRWLRRSPAGLLPRVTFEWGPLNRQRSKTYSTRVHATPDAQMLMTERWSMWRLVVSNKGPSRENIDRTRLVHRDRMQASVRSFLTSLRTATLAWPDAEQCSTRVWSTASGPPQKLTGRAGALWLASARLAPSRALLPKLTGHAGAPRGLRPVHKNSEEYFRKIAESHLYRSNSTSFANVLTPPSVHHHVHVC
jgi:hypothetical protein